MLDSHRFSLACVLLGLAMGGGCAGGPLPGLRRLSGAGATLRQLSATEMGHAAHLTSPGLGGELHRAGALATELRRLLTREAAAGRRLRASSEALVRPVLGSPMRAAQTVRELTGSMSFAAAFRTLLELVAREQRVPRPDLGILGEL